MIQMGELFDFYGNLLTSRQIEFMEFYFRQDLSLGEIAEKCNVSRQAVYDNLHRSEKLLKEYDEKLQLLAKTEIIKEKIQHVIELIEDLECESDKYKEIIKVLNELS